MSAHAVDEHGTRPVDPPESDVRARLGECALESQRIEVGCGFGDGQRVLRTSFREQCVRAFDSARREPRRGERDQNDSGDGNRSADCEPTRPSVVAHAPTGGLGEQDPGAQEDRRGHGDEVEREVERRIEHVPHDPGQEGGRGRALRARQAAHAPYERYEEERGRSAPDEAADQPELREELERRAVGRRDGKRILPHEPVDDREARRPGSGQRLVAKGGPGLVPPGPPVVGAETREPIRFLRKKVRGRIGELAQLAYGPPGRKRRDTEPD